MSLRKNRKKDKDIIMPVNESQSSFLAEGLTFKDGNLSGVGKITVNCYFVGNIITSDMLIVAEAGSILGNIEARSINIFGNVKGNIEASESVHLKGSGVLNGNVKCASLEIDIGAAFSGNCNMTNSKKENNILNTLPKTEEIPLKSR